MKRIIQFLLLVLLNVYAVNSNAIPTFFDQDSYQKIIHNKKDSNFLMLLWSLDCQSCIEDLSVVSLFHKNNPGIDIVMISTDQIIRLNEISSLMSEYGLNDVEQWIFQSNQFNQLSKSIDPQWRGELPRSYFYTSGERISTLSGRLHKADFDKWLLDQNSGQSKVSKKAEAQ